MWAGEPQNARVGKLKELRLEMWKRMHIPVPDQWRWLSAVLRGHYGYYGLTGNYRAMKRFVREVVPPALRAGAGIKGRRHGLDGGARRGG